MDRIRFSGEDVKFLLEWRDNHQDEVRSAPCPMKAVKLEFPETKFVITAIREEDILTCTVNQNGLSIGKIVYQLVGFGQWKVTKNKTYLQSDNLQSILTVYGSAMALLVYGNADREYVPEEPVDPLPEPTPIPNKNNRKKKKPHRKSSGITYILRKSGDSKILRPTGGSRKITVEFSVRGHFRHYKSGKVVWIAEYRKGRGRKQNHTYLIGDKTEP